jgi:hypothetical protein
MIYWYEYVIVYGLGFLGCLVVSLLLDFFIPLS